MATDSRSSTPGILGDIHEIPHGQQRIHHIPYPARHAVLSARSPYDSGPGTSSLPFPSPSVSSTGTSQSSSTPNLLQNGSGQPTSAPGLQVAQNSRSLALQPTQAPEANLPVPGLGVGSSYPQTHIPFTNQLALSSTFTPAGFSFDIPTQMQETTYIPQPSSSYTTLPPTHVVPGPALTNDGDFMYRHGDHEIL